MPKVLKYHTRTESLSTKLNLAYELRASRKNEFAREYQA